MTKLRGLESNQRPPGYEPGELPLLHLAISLCKYTTFIYKYQIKMNIFIIFFFEYCTGVEPVNEVLQTTTLAAWFTVHIQGTSSLRFEWIRTIDLQAKNLKFYPLNYKSKVNFFCLQFPYSIRYENRTRISSVKGMRTNRYSNRTYLIKKRKLSNLIIPIS